MNVTYIRKRIFDIFFTIFFDEDSSLIFISSKSNFFDDIKKNFKNLIFEEIFKSLKSEIIFNEIESYFKKQIISFSFKYKLIGTNFQISVWEELKNLKYGEIVTYTEIAQRINCPKAIRSVASTIAKNPLLIIIPCHRVNGKNNNLTGYRGDLELKQYLQELEKQNY